MILVYCNHVLLQVLVSVTNSIWLWVKVMFAVYPEPTILEAGGGVY